MNTDQKLILLEILSELLKNGYGLNPGSVLERTIKEILDSLQFSDK